MPADAFDKADVVASMFDNVAKCMADNAALLRQLHGRAESGALPGPSAAEGKASAKRQRAATKEEKVLRMLSNSCRDAWSVTHSTPHPRCAQAEKRKTSTRTLTSYQLFMAGERENSSSLKQLVPKEIMTEIGRRWKLLDAAAKAPWEAKAARLKQARLAELQGASSAPPPSPKAGHAGDTAEEQQQKKKKKKDKKDKKDKH